jgi:DNA-binding CsgD family transcriptional regulator
MRHVYFFYFFITVIFGVGSLTITTVLYRKTREWLLQQYLGFYAVFTLTVICSTSFSYIDANLPALNPIVPEAINQVMTVSISLLMFAIPICMSAFCGIPRTLGRDLVFGGLAIFRFIGFNIFQYAITEERIQRFGPYLNSTLFMIVLAYTIMAGFFLCRRLPDGDRKQAAQKFLVLLLIFLPGLYSDLFLDDIVPVQIFPFLYCGYSVVFTHHFLKHYYHPTPVATPTPAATRMTSTADLFAQHNISPREQEIILLVLQGYSNQKIAETLFISLHTVKTHLRNIYPKFEVSSRYELISLFQNPSGLLNSD